MESYLARLYTDPEALRRFLNNPLEEAIKAGLTSEESEAFQNIDRAGLELAALSFERKRAIKQKLKGSKGLSGFFRRLLR